MYFSSLKPFIYGMLISALIVLTLTGCMDDLSSTQHGGHIGATSTIETTTTTTEPSQTQSAPHLNQDTFFDLSGLDIQSKALACPLDAWVYQNAMAYAGRNIVLTDPSASFDDGSIADVAASIDQNNPSLLPHNFTSVLAGLGVCFDYLEITNTNPDIIQISQMTLRYTVASQVNHQHYNLINVCSLPISSESLLCSGGRGSPGGGQVYHFALPSGKSGTIVSSEEAQPLSLEPKETVKMEWVFSPADTANTNSIYSFVPQFTLNTSSQIHELAQLTSYTVFVGKNAVSCYQLQHNDTFLPMSDFEIGIGGSFNAQGLAAYECI